MTITKKHLKEYSSAEKRFFDNFLGSRRNATWEKKLVQLFSLFLNFDGFRNFVKRDNSDKSMSKNQGDLLSFFNSSISLKDKTF